MSLISSWRAVITVLVVSVGVAAVPGAAAGQATERVELSDDASWLDVVNHHRLAAGLAPVTHEPTWIPGLRAHLDYLRLTPPELRTGAYANSHRQNPASPWATAAGEEAARSSNIGFGRTDRDAIEGWLTAPFHAIGLLRPGWERTAFARDPESGRAVLDVLRGRAPEQDDQLVLFPADGATTRLREFTGELPDPLESCPGFTAPSGLPIIALLPDAPTAGTTATVTLADGRTLSPGSELCVVTAASYRSSDPVHGETGRSILERSNAVLVIPRTTLTDGTHTVSLVAPGVATVVWSFEVADVDARPTVAGTGTGAGAAAGGDGSAVLAEGYLLVDALGSVTSFGSAPAARPTTSIVEATDIAVTPSGDGYWVLRVDGSVDAVGDAASLPAVSAMRAGERATAISATPSGGGYWVFTDRGRVLPAGSAESFGDVSDLPLNGPILDAVATPSGRGYYLVASDGGVFAFGDAEFAGSMGGLPLNAPVRSLAPDPDGEGYWLVADDGGVFAFDATFIGSMGGTVLNAPMVGIVARGDGYTTVAADGGVFSYGAPFLGSLGATGSVRPVVAISPVG